MGNEPMESFTFTLHCQGTTKVTYSVAHIMVNSHYKNAIIYEIILINLAKKCESYQTQPCTLRGTVSRSDLVLF